MMQPTLDEHDFMQRNDGLDCCFHSVIRDGRNDQCGWPEREHTKTAEL